MLETTLYTFFVNVISDAGSKSYVKKYCLKSFKKKFYLAHGFWCHQIFIDGDIVKMEEIKVFWISCILPRVLKKKLSRFRPAAVTAASRLLVTSRPPQVCLYYALLLVVIISKLSFIKCNSFKICRFSVSFEIELLLSLLLRMVTLH